MVKLIVVTIERNGVRLVVASLFRIRRSKAVLW